MSCYCGIESCRREKRPPAHYVKVALQELPPNHSEHFLARLIMDMAVVLRRVRTSAKDGTYDARDIDAILNKLKGT